MVVDLDGEWDSGYGDVDGGGVCIRDVVEE